MADNEKVIVHERSGGGGIAALVVVLLIAVLVVVFFAFGGTKMFAGNSGETVNVHISGAADDSGK